MSQGNTPTPAYLKVVLHVLPRGKRALSDGARAVHDTRVVLVEAMPVDAGGLVPQTIVHVHNQAVPEVYINLRAGPLTVDTNHRALKSIGGGIDPGDVPVEVDVFRCGQLGGPAGQKKQAKFGHAAGSLNKRMTVGCTADS